MRSPRPVVGDPGAGRPQAARVVITGMEAYSAYGRGTKPLLDGVLSGQHAFTPVTRFEASRRAPVAATLPDPRPLLDELTDVIDEACADAGLSPAQRAACPLLLAWHPDPETIRAAGDDQAPASGGRVAAGLAARCGLAGALRTYLTACVSASSAVADAAAMIAAGRAERVIVAAGYLVEQDYFALFDAGRAMASDGRVRPFSARRKGLLLGDGIAAAVLESAASARERGARDIAQVIGWSRAGDAYHVCRPHPEGLGLARAVQAALARAQIPGGEIGYVNAHGTGTPFNDTAEAAGLRLAFGANIAGIPVSSTKSLHGHTVEVAGLLELLVTILAVGTGWLPVNAGYLGPDEQCRLDLVLDRPRPAQTPYALSVNAAFGGANTALIVAVR
jgi:3-oxoacyl-(acyl-carrier-protein) synthase